MQVYQSGTGREYFAINGGVFMVSRASSGIISSCMDSEDFPSAIDQGLLTFKRIMTPGEYIMKSKTCNSTNC